MGDGLKREDGFVILVAHPMVLVSFSHDSIDSQFSIPKFTQPPNRLRSPNPRSKTTAEMANKKSEGEDISSAQAVFLGALAPGVNVRIVIPDSLCIIKSSVIDNRGD